MKNYIILLLIFILCAFSKGQRFTIGYYFYKNGKCVYHDKWDNGFYIKFSTEDQDFYFSGKAFKADSLAVKLIRQN